MARKRTKPWWQLLRGPRGHRGLPGQMGVDAVAFKLLGNDLMALKNRVAELERKMVGPRDREDAAVLGRTPTPEAAIRKMEGSQK